MVVSSKKGKEWAIAISYPDQFGKIHIEEMDVNINNVVKIDPEWEDETKFIDSEANKVPTYAGFRQSYGTKYNNINTAKDKISKEVRDWNQGFLFPGEEPDIFNADQKTKAQFESIEDKFYSGKMSQDSYDKKLKKLGYTRYGDLI